MAAAEPVAEPVTAVPVAESQAAVRYVWVSAGESQSYLVKSDGSVCRTAGGGKISHVMNPAPGTKYISASSGVWASYLLRDDGVICRTTGGGTLSSEIAPPEKTRYIQVAAGENASYFLRSDGVVDRSKKQGIIERSIEPPAGFTYTQVSVGMTASYLLRSDGIVDRVAEGGLLSSGGDVTQTMQCSEKAVKYISVAGGLYASYLLRDDGKIDRTTGKGVVSDTIDPPTGVTYTGISHMLAVTETDKRAGPHVWYFLRSDGAADRVTGDSATVSSTMNPPPGLSYDQVSTSIHASYFLQSDGTVARSTRGGTINLDQTMDAAHPTHSNSDGCCVM